MDTKKSKNLKNDFYSWCERNNKQPKSLEEVQDLLVTFITENKEKYPEEYAKIQNALKQKTTRALHGAKLNYFKSLKHQCAEDEEVVYYKKGGSVTCGCKKKEEGGEVRKAGLGCSTAVKEFKKMKSGKKITIKQQPQVNPSDTVHVNGIAYSVTNSDGSPVDKRFKPYSGKVEEEDRKKAKKGDKDALKRQLKQELASSEKCGGKVKKHQEGSVIAKFKALRKGGSLNGVPFMQAGTSNRGIHLNEWKEKQFDPLSLNPTKEEFYRLLGLPSNFSELDYNTRSNLFKEAYSRYLKSQQPDSTRIIIPSELLKEPQFNIDTTLVLPPVLFDLSKIRRVKYRQGGNLNRIPFYQGGTPEGGITRGINGEYYTMPIPYGAGLDWGPEKLDNSTVQIVTSTGDTLNIPKYMTLLLTGAPGYLPGMKAKNAWEALQMVKAMKALKAAKTVSKVAKPKSIATGPKTVKLGNGYSAQIEVPDLPNYLELFDAYRMTRASRLNINNILDKLPAEERANVLKVMMNDPEKYLGRWLGNITPQRAASSITNIRRRLPGEYTSLRVKSLDLTRPNMGTGVFLKFDDATSKTAGFKRTTKVK